MDLPNTRLRRDDSRPMASSPLIVVPIASSVPSCSEPSRYGLARAEHAERLVRRPTLTAPASDGLALLRIGTKKRAFRSNKETDEGQKHALHCRTLDKRSPIQGLLSVHSRCGLHTCAVTNSRHANRRLQPLRYLHDCSDCFRLERLPGGACTHWKAPSEHDDKQRPLLAFS